MNTETAALEHQAKTVYKSEVAQIFAVQGHVARKEQVPLSLAVAVGVLTKKGHLRYSEKAKRLMFTPEGAKFARQSRKYAGRLGH